MTDSKSVKILLVGTLDTKGAEYAYARDIIRSRGLHPILMDAGVMGQPQCEPDVSADEVARAGGSDLLALREKGSRSHALEFLTRGAVSLAKDMSSQLAGVLALGGSGGTAVGTAVMRALPVGLPKVMVSTLASGDVAPYIGESDIAMMYSVADIAGLNRISRVIIKNAADAVCGMAAHNVPARVDERPLIAATMFGVTTPCVTRLREHLERSGFEVVVFHATGSGGRAMEKLIADGFFEGVADVTTTEWCDEVVGGVLSAGPQRLEAAIVAGIPQVVSCGALDMVNYWALETVPVAFRERTLHPHNANVTLMRTSPDECVRIGREIGTRLSRARAPVTLMIPLRGVSMLDAQGKTFFAPESNEALFASLRANCAPSVTVKEYDLHINDPEFANAISDELIHNLQWKRSASAR
ncbi:MAG: Tm-1-like ATP-binding domain-containing protein [Bacteroidetes bacterium]|nr:Tm-1-like ATP-binding domain-containing protein [Bacteroidota bacterium]